MQFVADICCNAELCRFIQACRRNDKKEPDSGADCSPFTADADRRHLRDFEQRSKHFVQILTDKRGH